MTTHEKRQMIYYAYFDIYGHCRQVIDQEELARDYNNDPDEFLKAVCLLAPDAGVEVRQGM